MVLVAACKTMRHCHRSSFSFKKCIWRFSHEQNSSNASKACRQGKQQSLDTGYRIPPPKVHSPSQNVQKARAYRPTGPCSYSFIIMIMSTISGPSQQQANWQTACPGPHAMPCLQAMGERESMRVGIPFGERLVRHHVRLMRGFIVVNCCYRVRLG